MESLYKKYIEEYSSYMGMVYQRHDAFCLKNPTQIVRQSLNKYGRPAGSPSITLLNLTSKQQTTIHAEKEEYNQTIKLLSLEYDGFRVRFDALISKSDEAIVDSFCSELESAISLRNPEIEEWNEQNRIRWEKEQKECEETTKRHLEQFEREREERLQDEIKHQNQCELGECPHNCERCRRINDHQNMLNSEENERVRWKRYQKTGDLGYT